MGFSVSRVFRALTVKGPVTRKPSPPVLLMSGRCVKRCTGPEALGVEAGTRTLAWMSANGYKEALCSCLTGTSFLKEHRFQVVRGLRGMGVWSDRSANPQPYLSQIHLHVNNKHSENLHLQGTHFSLQNRVTHSSEKMRIPESV